MVGHGITLNAAQLAHLERKYASNARDFQRDWLQLSPAEQLDKRMKQTQDRLEMVYGSLGEGQRAAVRQFLERTPFRGQQILQERRRRQQDTMAVLRKLTNGSVPPDEARDLVRGLLDRMLTSPDPAYRAYQDALRLETCRLVAQVHNGSTAAQREHAVRRLRGWQRDLQELAARS